MIQQHGLAVNTFSSSFLPSLPLSVFIVLSLQTFIHQIPSLFPLRFLIPLFPPIRLPFSSLLSVSSDSSVKAFLILSYLLFRSLLSFSSSVLSILHPVLFRRFPCLSFLYFHISPFFLKTFPFSKLSLSHVSSTISFPTFPFPFHLSPFLSIRCPLLCCPLMVSFCHLSFMIKIPFF